MSTPAAGSRARRIAIAALLTWTAAVTVLRAVRWPNDFAEAHWLLDYRFGFIRRGLVGEVVRQVAGAFGAPLTEGVIATLAASAFAALWLALGVVTWRLLRRFTWSSDAVLALLVFLSSPFVVMGAHFMGYLDHVILLLSIVAIALLLGGHVVAAAVIQSIAVLVHESAIVVGCPAWALALWLVARKTGRPLLRQLWPVVLPLAAFVLVAVADRAQHQEDLQERLSRRLARARFVGGDMHVFVPEWLAESFSENYAVHSRHFTDRLTSAPMHGLVLPSILTLGFLAVRRLRPRALDLAVAAGAVAAPLVLHLAAFDTARIWTFTIVAAFVASWVLAETHPDRDGRSRTFLLIAVVALVANVMMTSPLMDGLSERFGLAVRLALYAPLAAAAAAVAARRL